MSTREVSNKADGVIAPRTGQAYAKAASTTATSIDVSAYPGRFVTVQADGAKIYILVDDVQATAEALDPTAVSGDTRCIAIPDGQSVSFLLSNDDNFIGFKTSAGTGTLRAWISSERF